MFRMSQMTNRSRPSRKWFCTHHNNRLADTTVAPRILFISDIEVFQKLVPDCFWTEFRSRNKTAAISVPLFQKAVKVAFCLWTFVACCTCESAVVKVR